MRVRVELPGRRGRGARGRRLRRLRPRALIAGLAGAAFGALTGLVWSGSCTRLDRYAVRHLMPWYHAGSHHLIHVAAVFEPETRGTLAGTLVALWTYPASPFVSGLVVLACAWVLERRGERGRAVAAALLWAAANVLELAGKLIVSRPPVGEPGFSDSFPSGHTVRAFLTAAVVAWAWPRAAAPAVLWAAGVGCALVAIGDHVPTDVLGGALLALALVAAASAASGPAI